MPTNLSIGFLVLGGVLVLVAVVGGHFKIFGAEISGRASAGGRWFAGVLGTLLIGVSAFGLALPPNVEPKSFSDATKQNVLTSCAASGATRTHCECALGKLEAAVSETELAAMETRISMGKGTAADTQVLADAKSCPQ